MTHNDKLLLDHLKSRLPKNWESVSDQVAMRLYEIRPQLISYVGKLNRLHDVEGFVDNVIWTAFESFRDQYLGKNVRMPFNDQHADRVDDLLKGWLLAMIGKPFAGNSSGMITNAIRQQDAEESARSKMGVEIGNPYERTASGIDQYLDVEKAVANVKSVLRTLPPKKEFVFRIHTGFHDQERLTPHALLEIARSCRLDDKSCDYIKFLANDVIADYNGRLTLDQASTGKLVAIKERRVRTIVSETRRAIVRADKSAEVSQPAR